MLGAAHVIVADIGRVGSPPLMPTIGVSPRGVIAFQRGGDLTSVRRRWVDRSGIPLDTTELAVNGPSASLSANGRYLAFDDNRTGVGRDVWIMDLARQVTSRLTPDGENASSPVWTPDDRHVIYRRGERIRKGIGCSHGGGCDWRAQRTPIVARRVENCSSSVRIERSWLPVFS